MNIPKVICGALLVLLCTGWSKESLAQDSALLAPLLDKAMYVDPETIIGIQNKYQTFIEISDKKRGEGEFTMGDELIEIGKITGMAVMAAILYGVIHDLVTTQINFAYFSDLHLTHHGAHTLRYFPRVYNSESPVLYALLWGTIATWWVGLPLGVLAAISARLNASAPKMTWDELAYPVATMLGINLALALITGGFTYLISGSSFSAVAAMHNSSYLFAIIGGIILPSSIFISRNSETSLAEKQCVGFTEAILHLFNEYPDTPDVQAIVRSHLNSPYGNCQHPM
ncbi:hypothetical protein [Endozoicomonas sp. ONNA2]|uniref:hypothetical protein n=1 Tax=Endozoicomonas sp. ONNA2 TaxID=2828741 RepID=UPI002149927B|nr:hypothetical protein [Endozoicomonas sp. ONNA2]